jgi:PTH1 family peptidyl-tRNA hydrolase
MKFLIVGLGNIGSEYEHTRHNIGFDVVEELALESKTFFENTRLAYRAEIKHRGRTLILIKPTTYMNLSGKAVNYWMQEEKIPVERILIITDDVALPFGTIRLRKSGSDGGHNGLSHIIQTINTVDFARARFGIGNNYPKGMQVDYVLSQFTNDEKKILPSRIQIACDIAKAFAANGVDFAMNSFNNK